MTALPDLANAGLVLHVAIEFALIVRVLLRPHRQPTSRVAWIVIIATLPVIGIAAYILLGEVNVGRTRRSRRHVLRHRYPLPAQHTGGTCCALPEPYAHLSRVGASISGFEPVAGNTARLMVDSDAAIDEMVADIDAATDRVHLVFYIWLVDRSGSRMADALTRAARRGVACRALVDDIGSRALVRSPHWRTMREAGVRLATALPVGNPLLRPFSRRLDLRNHRKILVVDSAITYCGSQNCADPEFRVKPKYAPWVDIMLRIEGPVAVQNELLFLADWMTEVDEDPGDIPAPPVVLPDAGFPAQTIGTGPTTRHSAMPELFESLMHAARSELIITTPYYVPDESMQDALRAAAYRGVNTTIVLPARNDSRFVSAASRSYYGDLLAAGVEIREFVGGLLHAKTLTVDGEVTLVGSANMDRRSFDLNYENNILL